MDCLSNIRMPCTISFEYDERLSQYETILFLIRKIKETIDRVNEIPPELQGWVLNLVNRELQEFEYRIQIVENTAAHMQDTVSDLEDEFVRYQKALNGQWSQWKKLTNQQIERQFDRQNRNIEKTRAYARSLVADVNILIVQLQEDLVKMLESANRFTLTQVDALRKEMEEIIGDTNANKLLVVNPRTKRTETLYQVLSDLWTQASLMSLTASEYDKIGLTAEQYDALNLYAAEYDRRAWMLLFKEIGLAPVYEYVDKMDAKWLGVAQEQIDEIDEQVNSVISPLSATKESLYTIILQVLKWVAPSAITAHDYDSRGMTAQEYDEKQFPALLFDMHGESMLGL